ncbi:hypothetical protein AVEN_113334-1 [Araneus ventricosus]|uniref:Uncharacterized protein n=1 Tax=Araneus ventricosus TaxID=182803 RepID=A0A4Y2HAS1_ARAVE|nr:hypothetical protein AVEN_113334-1 [Araneus ventricosus]
MLLRRGEDSFQFAFRAVRKKTAASGRERKGKKTPRNLTCCRRKRTVCRTLNDNAGDNSTFRGTGYREDSSTFEIPYLVAKFVAQMGAKVRGPDVAAVDHLILTPVKLSSQP